MTSKTDIFSDSIKNVLSDLQNKEHENSQIEVFERNITLLQKEKKIKGHYYRIITRNTEERCEVLIRPNAQTLSIIRKSQPKTTTTASGPLSTPSPTPATISGKPSIATLATVSRK